MTRRYRVVLAAGLVAASFAGAALRPVLSNAVPNAAQADVPQAVATVPPNSITVSTSGIVNMAPDMATVTFGAQSERQSAQDAQDDVNRVIAAAVKNLHALHIPDRQIQTQNISLQPHYDNSGNVTGYDASQTLAVTVYGLRSVSRVVDAGVSAHANSNVSVSFGLRNENAARDSALKLAVRLARSRAATAASALGRSLSGAHVQLTENAQSTPQPRPVTYGAVNASPSQTTTQTFGGTLAVEEDVTLTYTF